MSSPTPDIDPAAPMSGFSRFAQRVRQVMQAALPEGQALLTVGEAPIATTSQAVEITHPDTGALSLVFQFEHMDLDTQPGCAKWAVKPLHLPDLKAVIDKHSGAAVSQAIGKARTITLEVGSDRNDTLHIHGDDLTLPLLAGKNMRLEWTPKHSGRFEIELHHSDAVLTQVDVLPR